MKKLVIASNTAGKLREIQAILAPLGGEVLTQAALGIAEACEPHLTFIENALANAAPCGGTLRPYMPAAPAASNGRLAFARP